MPRFRLRRKAICYFICINVVLFLLFNAFHRNNSVSLNKFSVNSSMKQLIQKLVPAIKPIKRVLTFEIGRPKPQGKASVCRFTQSDGLELLAETYLYPRGNEVERKCPGTTMIICATSGVLGAFQINCGQHSCGATVRVGSLNKETGEVQWEDVSSSKLETFIQQFVLKNIDEMYPFFYLTCGDIEKPALQLVTVPVATASNSSSASKKEINVNILFVDAVSRRHFYRSLPKTVAAFSKINLNPKSTANVLDFELYQALRATPQETLLGFVTGQSNNSHSTMHKTLLSHFKQAGYQTLWQDDECWTSDVSFTSYFGVQNIETNLQKLKVKMESDGMDSLGLTHSSCLRINENGNNKLKNDLQCINGKFQHDYFFDYIMQSLNEVNGRPSSKPLFSLTSLSLGKEESGRQVQRLDDSLASFVRKMAADKNTITILFSDHGNTFELFPVQTMEGQYEQYNPFLFIILPTFVAWRLGESKKKNLLNNQIKVISVSDVHKMVWSLVEDKSNSNKSRASGLFAEIDYERNCAQLDMSPSSLCICDGWSSKQQPSMFHYIIAEFALGQLNNMIAIQHTNQKAKDSPFVTCERLRGVLLRNVSQKRNENGYIISQIDIYVQGNELFRVNVKWHGDNNPAMEMALVNYERKHSDPEDNSCSTYIDRDLCVCSTQSKNIPNWKNYGSVFKRRTKADNRHNRCLYILTRDYGVSTVFEAANMCSDVEYDIQINFELENMRTPGEVPVNATIPPKCVKFLTLVMPLHLTNPGNWEYEVHFSLRRMEGV